MGSENLSPLEELKRLDQQIDPIQSLAGLQPLFARLEEITRQHSDDFEVQLVAHDVKQHILTRGSRIKQMPPPPVVTVPLAAPPPPVVEPELVQPTKHATGRNRSLVWLFATLLALGGIGAAWKLIQQRNLNIAATTPVDAVVSTVPPGAAIVINGQEGCTSDCAKKLPPGTYQVAAMLDGYEGATGQLTVEPGKAASLKLTLTPQSPSVRIVADLEKGTVFLDDEEVGELQDGQLVLDRVTAGPHTVRVVGASSEAQFTFNAAPGAIPAVEGPIATKNLFAALVANLGAKARVITSGGPMKLTVNGQAEADATPDGVDVSKFQAGSDELVLGEGKEQRTLTETYNSASTLTAFLKTDRKIGTLLVTTGQDDVRIFVNNKENARRTAKGQARIQTIGDVTVRVEKVGFEVVPAQKVKVAQGAETKVNFTLKALPQFSILSINGGTPGTEVVLSQRVIGTVGVDGSFRNASVTPGEHVIELRRDVFEPKRFTRGFRAGDTVTIGAADATLVPIRVAPPPPPPPVVPKPEPPPVKITAAPKPRSGDISNFDNPGAWHEDDGVWRHRGGGTLTYGLPPNGIFTFSIYMLKGGSVLRGGRVRWVVNYVDAQNYGLFELDAENFWAKVVTKGKTVERKKVAHKQDKSMRVWNIQIDVNASRVVHKIQDDDGWVDLDTWTETDRDFTSGKFGILVSGTDEVGLSNFTYTGR